MVEHGLGLIEGPKIRIIANNGADDPGSVTFVINNEDHTLGNALRYIIMKK